MPTVYVTQEQPKFNITPAMEFGEIKVLLPPGVDVYHSGGQVADQLKPKLSNYSDEDYLLLIGDPIGMCITCAVAGYWNNGKVKLLRWDRQEHKYIPVSVKLY